MLILMKQDVSGGILEGFNIEKLEKDKEYDVPKELVKKLEGVAAVPPARKVFTKIK